MRVENRSVTRSTAWRPIPGAVLLPLTTGAVAPSVPSYLLSDGGESFITSMEAAMAQNSVIEFAYNLSLFRSPKPSASLIRRESLFPTVVDASEDRLATGELHFAASRAKERLAARLQAAFDADPLEDGMNHPAEEIIERELRKSENDQALEWFKDISLDSTQPAFAASVLRCMGRLDRLGTAVCRIEVVQAALVSDEVEMRDAAVQTAESWGDSEMSAVLERHSESIPWLQDYIRDVVEGLRE